MVEWNGDPSFTDEAFARIHAIAGGVPRKINTLCSRLLLSGYLDERHEIDQAVVEQVADELGEEIAQVTTPGPSDLDFAMAANGGNSHVHLNGNGNGKASHNGSGDLPVRVAMLEHQMRNHDRTIKRALEIAADYLSSARS